MPSCLKNVVIIDQNPTYHLLVSWWKRLWLTSLIIQYFSENQLLDPQQFAYVICHSTETAILQVKSDIQINIDQLEGNCALTQAETHLWT